MRKAQFFLLIAVFSLILTGNAYAYIDLGTGSYLFQIILGAFLLFVYSIKTFLLNLPGRFKNLIKKLKNKHNNLRRRRI